MRRTLLVVVVLSFLLVDGPQPVFADIIILDAVDSGRYDQTGFHEPADAGYMVGSLGSQVFRNWFVFDLSGVLPGSVTAGELVVFNPVGGYVSTSPTLTFNLSEVSTAIDVLRAGGAGQLGIYNDLLDGLNYGKTAARPGDVGTDIPVPLSSDALAALNRQAGSLFAIGGAITSGLIGNQALFVGSSDAHARRLVLTATPVPEPASIVLLVCAAALMGGWSMTARTRRATVQPR